MLLKRKPKKSYLLKYRGTQCLNCEHPLDLSDRYCPKCSQINSTKRITFFDLLHEFMDAVFSYDSKFRLTIAVIIRYPGKISQEYVAGRRMMYTNPFRFFLSILFITIILLNFAFDLEVLDEGIRKNIDKVGKERERIASDTAAIKQIQESKAQLESYGIKTTEIKVDTSATKNEKKMDSIYYSRAQYYFDSINKAEDAIFERVAFKGDIFNYGITKDTLLSFDHLTDKMKVENTWENRIAYKVGYNQYKLKNSPSLYFAYLINKLPFVIFFLIPFLALFIWIIYSKKKFYYMDHLVFCYHTLTMLIFAYLLCLIVFLITHHGVILTILITSIIFYNWFYLYKAMRRFYAQSRLKTFLKYIYINTIFSILATITLLVFIGVSFLLF